MNFVYRQISLLLELFEVFLLLWLLLLWGGRRGQYVYLEVHNVVECEWEWECMWRNWMWMWKVAKVGGGRHRAPAQIVRKDERTAEKRNKRLNGMNGKGTRKGKKRINLKKYFNNMFCLSHTQTHTHTHAQAQTHQNQSRIEQMRNENAVTYNKMNHFCRSNEKKSLFWWCSFVHFYFGFFAVIENEEKTFDCARTLSTIWFNWTANYLCNWN